MNKASSHEAYSLVGEAEINKGLSSTNECYDKNEGEVCGQEGFFQA